MKKAKIALCALILVVGMLFAFDDDDSCSVSLDCGDGGIISCTGPAGTCDDQPSEPDEPGWVECNRKKTNCYDDEIYLF